MKQTNNERDFDMEKTPLSRLYHLSFASASLPVRRAATFLLVHGVVEVDFNTSPEVLVALEAIGCCAEYSHDGVYEVRCDGARDCYANEDFYL